MRANIKTFVGLDVHKDSIAIAYADTDFSQPPRFLGTTGYSVISLTKALAKLASRRNCVYAMKPGHAVTVLCGHYDRRAMRPT